MNKALYILVSILLSLCLVQAQQPSQVAYTAQNTNDINTLNYALTLEHLEAAFYTQGQATFNTTSFAQAGLPASAYNYLSLIGSHENAHVTLLSGALGSQAVQPCTYNFTYAMSSVYAYIATARLLEETGVSAYDGAANTINSAGYLQTAATIATIEARHASYLNQLLSYIAVFNSTGQFLPNITGVNVSYPYSPFPLSFDAAIAPANILAAAAGFIVSCPATPVLPVIAYTITPYNFSTGYNASVFNSSGQYLSQAQFNNDNLVLNFSLTLELLGRAFYSTVAAFTPAQFQAAGYNYAVWNNFQMIIAHELAHVNFLNTTLIARGATPAQPCTYNIGNYTANVTSALAFARMLENLEVTAYDGAINSLTQYDLIQGAATIATVEARHGNYLNNVVNGTGVQPNAVDLTNTPANILAITAPYFGAGCVAPTLPVLAYTLQAQYVSVQSTSPSTANTVSPSISTTSTVSATNTASATLGSSASLSSSTSSTPSSSNSPSPSYNAGGASSRMTNFLSWLL